MRSTAGPTKTKGGHARPGSGPGGDDPNERGREECGGGEGGKSEIGRGGDITPPLPPPRLPPTPSPSPPPTLPDDDRRFVVDLVDDLVDDPHPPPLSVIDGPSAVRGTPDENSTLGGCSTTAEASVDGLSHRASYRYDDRTPGSSVGSSSSILGGGGGRPLGGGGNDTVGSSSFPNVISTERQTSTAGRSRDAASPPLPPPPPPLPPRKAVERPSLKHSGIEVAWNVVKLSGVPKAERTRIVNEVRLLERLHHPNIISFHGSWVNRETERVIFVTEILSSGTLKSFVQKVQLIRWKIFRRWAIQILNGLEYLHSQDPPIIHRDLKCDNIFINGTSGDLRIGDFGLSTAISKKNQPLSVLGTPEFMAPELYDENYNEKVDIYAFGMLLLEIITRDVPYHECANPAQIYKKVTQGIPPPSLHRVKSIDARNFILLCLGIGEDANARPSASDLLKHQFLAKNSDDEMTIELEPAVQDTIIEEAAQTSMTFSDDSGSHGSVAKVSGNGDKVTMKSASSTPCLVASSMGQRNEVAAALENMGPNPLESKELTQSVGTVDDEQIDDQFGKMPENEANMKKVTVLMGRGTALTNNEPPAKEMEVISLSSTPPPTALAITSPSSVIKDSDTSNLGSSLPYKVWAVPPAVIDGGNKPYPNNTINLALTLPDVSQTTIEFTFDLVDDDPVQIAREMVTELDEVPDDAVLEISTAISAVAREARMKQNQWTQLQQQQQQNVLAQQALHQQHQQHSQSMMALHSPGSVGIQPQPTQAPQGVVPSHQQHVYGSGFSSTDSFQRTSFAVVEPQPGPLCSDLSQTVVSGPVSILLQSQQRAQHHAGQIPPLPPEPSQFLIPPSSQMSTLQMSTPQPQQQKNSDGQSLSMPSSPSTSIQLAQEPNHIRRSTDSNVQRSSSMDFLSHNVELSTNLAAAQAPALSTLSQQQQHLLTPTLSNSSQDMITSRQFAPQGVSITQDASDKLLHQGHNASLQREAHNSQPSEGLDDGNNVEADAEAEEIRKLEQELEKKLQRAKKSYHTRMDNLQRSKEEVEAQHQMLLEKHEKERIEFEKRVRLAEEEQARRLNQIQQEFLEKKREVRQQRARLPPTSMAPMHQMQNGNDGKGMSGSRPPLHGGHKRSSSHFDSSMAHISPTTLDHTRNSCESNVTESSQAQIESPQHHQQPP
ncbi:hypothetical protein ACHAXA_009955 [Cyclostephanos tholiformis]|uniref:Protein kinase domain-containing protein n=1 Tax=Cyclostephanos tholiformis TaxID=382380 RepID=A0ABD3RY10_9STRA